MIDPTGKNAKKPVTLKSVAERAGTSIQTVSTVLNNSRSNTVVSAETRARILSVAKEMHYRRNPLARSLRRGYTNIIGFYTGYGAIRHTNPFIAEVFGGIQSGCNEHRKDLLIHGTFRGNSVDDIYEELTNGKIDGLVIFAPSNDNLVRRLRAAPLPVVSIADAIPGILSVTMDDLDGGRQVAKYLYNLGHRHILYRQPQNGFVSALQRLDGLRSESDQRRMTITPIVTADDPVHGISARERSLLMAKESDRPTAVVCWCDAAAEIVLQFLFDNNISVPEQMAVVGFDGFNLPYTGGVRLTTVVSPWAEAGHRAVSLLVNEETNAEPAERIIQFPMQLRIGNTT